MDNLYNSSCVGGAAGYIDRWILGINHIYSNPTPKPIYGSGPFDPEGILGMFEQVWASLSKFELVWDKFEQVLNNFWTSLNKFWTSF